MKRGQETLQTTMIFEVLISILVAGILFWALFNFNDLSFSNKKYIDKDIKQITKFIDSMQGDVEINYPILNVNYDGDSGKSFTDEFCKLKIIKKGETVSYEC